MDKRDANRMCTAILTRVPDLDQRIEVIKSILQSTMTVYKTWISFPCVECSIFHVRRLLLTKLIRISRLWIHTDCLMCIQTYLDLLSLHLHHFLFHAHITCSKPNLRVCLLCLPWKQGTCITDKSHQDQSFMDPYWLSDAWPDLFGTSKIASSLDMALLGEKLPTSYSDAETELRIKERIFGLLWVSSGACPLGCTWAKSMT
jgi:hypothetical protein